VKVAQKVMVTVTEVDIQRKRIALSMKAKPDFEKKVGTGGPRPAGGAPSGGQASGNRSFGGSGGDRSRQSGGGMGNPFGGGGGGDWFTAAASKGKK
jgi:uncharacterized protein